MFDRIIYISDKAATVKLSDNAKLTANLMNLHLVFEDKDKKILAEVDDVDDTSVKARFLGEITDGKLVGGVIRKPSLDAKARVIAPEEIPLIVGVQQKGMMQLGYSPFYNDVPVYMNINNFFSNHFAIFGNSGSGKSCGISRIFQNVFNSKDFMPYRANLIVMDSSGEYYNAFKNLNLINPKYNYRFISTNEEEKLGENLRIPIWLLSVDDMCLLLQVDKHSQIPIIERMLKLANAFVDENNNAEAFKNHLIAKAIMAILYTNETSPNKRNEIFSILGSCSTKEFNLEAVLEGIGYTRKFRECFLIDSKGQFSESVLLTNYVASFIKEEFETYEPKYGGKYDLVILEKALNFTLISEGWLRNENTYGDAVTIKVRLHALITGKNAKYFDVSDDMNVEGFISSLIRNDDKKYQIININFDDVDDSFAKTMTKIYSRIVFDFAKGLTDRASIPFHLIIEEAHRYIQNDNDRYLLGYNIFERIAKEGRKYGVILGLISQRPVELSDTVISQCSNFLIFKMNHPVDVEYIRKMVPNISDEIVEKQKSLQSGTCLGFGSAFRIPLIVKLQMPDPEPKSGNCNVEVVWETDIGSSVSNAAFSHDIKAVTNYESFIENNAGNNQKQENLIVVQNNSGSTNTSAQTTPQVPASSNNQNDAIEQLIQPVSQPQPQNTNTNNSSSGTQPLIISPGSNNEQQSTIVPVIPQITDATPQNKVNLQSVGAAPQGGLDINEVLNAPDNDDNINDE